MVRLKPDYNLKNIYEIDLEDLKSRGVKLIMFDLDSTIMVSKSCSYLPETLSWLNKVKENFKIVVVSNNSNKQYMDKVRSISDFEILSSCSKPNINKVKSYLDSNGISPKESVIVGDRPLTDILCGKRLGCLTVLVGSINAENEGIATRLVRKLERLTIKK